MSILLGNAYSTCIYFLKLAVARAFISWKFERHLQISLSFLDLVQDLAQLQQINKQSSYDFGRSLITFGPAINMLYVKVDSKGAPFLRWYVHQLLPFYLLNFCVNRDSLL